VEELAGVPTGFNLPFLMVKQEIFELWRLSKQTKISWTIN
jgi:hypothetical protein